MLHRFILRVADPKVIVDHFPDPRGLNCQKHNLRPASFKENVQNQRLRINNTSGYKGVTLQKDCGRWKAAIGASIYLGLFPTAKQAALAYDVKARELFGEFANTNF
jgi:hypothetical protein